MNRLPLRFLLTLLACATLATGCSERAKVTELTQLDGLEVALPTGTVADQLVLAKLPQAKIKYFNSALDSAMAVKAGKADAAAYDEPILRNIAAKVPGLTVLAEPISVDQYGFAMRQGDAALKAAVDGLVAEMKASGEYEQMRARWLPAQGAPAAMPAIPAGTGEVLRFGTASVTEPFSFVDGSQQVVGLDIEIAARVAQRLNRKLEIVNMEFGGMIPALIAGKVDLIGACITITEERKKSVLFSEPYYTGGISALVRQ
jgi:polar amino acid transport system substrate-binding protein